MKKIVWGFLILLCLMPVFALAQAVDSTGAVINPVFVPPAWLQSVILGAIAQFPTVGKFVVIVAQWAGVLASVLTILAGALHGLFSIVELGLGNKLSADQLASFQKIYGNILYYLKYFSMFNAQKPADPAPAIAVADPVQKAS